MLEEKTLDPEKLKPATNAIAGVRPIVGPVGTTYVIGVEYTSRMIWLLSGC